MSRKSEQEAADQANVTVDPVMPQQGDTGQQDEAAKRQTADKESADKQEAEKKKQISPDVVGSTLAGHLNKYQAKRQERAKPDAHGPEQQKADERAMRHLVADLLVSNESSVLKVLTETEQAQARALAAKLQAS